MASLMPNGKQQYTDPVSGLPLAFGTVTTLSPGTQVPLITWADANETIPNPNPVPLDANGLASIFWNGTYDVRVKTRTGRLVYTQSNVSSPLSSAALAATTGSSLVGFTAAFTGATNLTVAEQLATTVNVKNFGAKGNNSTNDSAAIQLAIQELSGSGYGRVYFPPGTYKGNIVVESSSIELVGTSGSAISGVSTTDWAVDFTSSTATNQCGLTNLGVICSVAGQIATVGGVRVKNQGNFVVNGLRVSGLGGQDFSIGLKVESSSQVTVRDTQLFNSAVNSFIGDQVGGLTMVNTLTSGAGNGYRMTGIDGCWAFNAYTAGNGADGWIIEKTGSGDNRNWFMHACGGDFSGGYNWLVTQLLRGFFYSPWGATQSSISMNPAASGMFLNTSAVQDIELHGPFFGNNNKAGLEIVDAINVKVFGGEFQDNANGGAGGSGIIIGGSATVTLIGATSNDTRGTPLQEYGVSISGTAVVRGGDCTLLPNLTGPLINTAAPNTTTLFHDNAGFNPTGIFLTPTFPASTVAVTNMTGVTTRVIYGVGGGSITAVMLNGGSTGLAGNGVLVLGVGESIALTYTGTGFWEWAGL